MVRVVITPSAQAEFAQLPRVIQARASAIFERLRQWPEVSGAKPLRENLSGHFRIRTGSYRIVFRPSADGASVTVWKIGNRGGVYDGGAAMKMMVQKGRKFVMVPIDAWAKIASGSVPMPALPEADGEGNRDALEFARATIARGIIRDRVAMGLSQAELARRAKIQPAVLNRIEKAKVVPDESTLKKIDGALRGGEPVAMKNEKRKTKNAK